MSSKSAVSSEEELAAKIRYVEEYTAEEWAAEATKLVQQEIVRFMFPDKTRNSNNQARRMAAAMERLLSTLEDALVSKITSFPDTVGF